MRPQCRGWHPTCSSRRRWVPALITWLVLIRRRDGVWWRCALSQLFLLFSASIDSTGPLCRRQQMSSSLSFFIKLKRIALTDAIILWQCSKSALLDVSRRVYYQIYVAASCRILGTSIRSHRSTDVGIEKVIRIFICPICAQRRQQAPVQRTRSICIRQYQQNRRSCCANTRWAGGQTPTPTYRCGKLRQEPKLWWKVGTDGSRRSLLFFLKSSEHKKETRYSWWWAEEAPAGTATVPAFVS